MADTSEELANLALAKAHEVRNIAEYEGRFEIDERLVRNLIEAADAVRKAAAALPPPP